MSGLLLVGVGLSLGASALLTLAETAVWGVRSSRVRTLEEEGFSGGKALGRLRGPALRVRSGLRVVLSVLNLTAMGLAVVWLQRVSVSSVLFIDLVAAALFVVLVGDILPRGIAARQRVRIALLTAPFLLRIADTLSVVARPVARLEGALSGGSDERDAEERELRELQELGAEEGLLHVEENRLVERAFHLDEMTAWDVMTPRVDVFAWDEALTLEAIMDELPAVPYSRVPVYRDSVDEITGVIYVREAYQAWSDGKGDATLGTLAREPFFVPGSLSLSHLLRDFQARRTHMGIVADEFGGIDGLVTLEDVLEELVGEIVDETDLDEESMVRVSDDEMVVDAGVDVRDVNEAFDVMLPILEHRSLNGLILEELGYVPPVGDRFERAGVELEVVDASDTQVLRVRLTRMGEPAPDTDG